jgi:hypothetical protein
MPPPITSPSVNNLYEKLNGICYIIIFVSFFIIFIVSNLLGKYSLQTNITCYITVLITVAFLFMTNIFIEYIPISRGLQSIFSDDSNYIVKIFSALIYVLKYAAPFFIFMLSIIILIYSMSKHFDNISDGNVSGYYYTFSYLFLILLITQMVVLFYNRVNEMNKSMSNKIYMILMLLSTISGISVITLSIILKYFTTDG